MEFIFSFRYNNIFRWDMTKNITKLYNGPQTAQFTVLMFDKGK